MTGLMNVLGELDEDRILTPGRLMDSIITFLSG
jgi:hypothetical protein